MKIECSYCKNNTLVINIQKIGKHYYCIECYEKIMKRFLKLNDK